MDPYIRLPRVPIFTNRRDFVLERCVGKNVLHIGCVDTGLLEERFQSGTLMLQQIEKVAKQQWGADIDEAGIAFLRSKGFTKLIVADASDIGDQPELRTQSFDVIVASELVEHLSNPGLFLDSVNKLMQPETTQLLVTVPNAFRIRTLQLLFRGVEYVHPDHNYWFSYHTITNLLRKHGFNIQSVATYSFLLPQPPERWTLRRILGRIRRAPNHLLARILFSFTPFWGDGVMVVATLSSNTRSQTATVER
jgi:predicted TPR repeat methyltransferase